MEKYSIKNYFFSAFALFKKEYSKQCLSRNMPTNPDIMNLLELAEKGLEKKALNSISLQSKNLSDSDIVPLIEALKIHKFVKKLDLSSNNLTDLKPFVDFLESNSNLEELNLSNNPIELAQIPVHLKNFEHNFPFNKLDLSHDDPRFCDRLRRMYNFNQRKAISPQPRDKKLSSPTHAGNNLIQKKDNLFKAGSQPPKSHRTSENELRQRVATEIITFGKLMNARSEWTKLIKYIYEQLGTTSKDNKIRPRMIIDYLMQNKKEYKLFDDKTYHATFKATSYTYEEVLLRLIAQSNKLINLHDLQMIFPVELDRKQSQQTISSISHMTSTRNSVERSTKLKDWAKQSNLKIAINRASLPGSHENSPVVKEKPSPLAKALSTRATSNDKFVSSPKNSNNGEKRSAIPNFMKAAMNNVITPIPLAAPKKKSPSPEPSEPYVYKIQRNGNEFQEPSQNNFINIYKSNSNPKQEDAKLLNIVKSEPTDREGKNPYFAIDADLKSATPKANHEGNIVVSDLLNQVLEEKKAERPHHRHQHTPSLNFDPKKSEIELSPEVSPEKKDEQKLFFYSYTPNSKKTRIAKSAENTISRSNRPSLGDSHQEASPKSPKIAQQMLKFITNGEVSPSPIKKKPLAKTTMTSSLFSSTKAPGTVSQTMQRSPDSSSNQILKVNLQNKRLPLSPSKIIQKVELYKNEKNYKQQKLGASKKLIKTVPELVTELNTFTNKEVSKAFEADFQIIYSLNNHRVLKREKNTEYIVNFERISQKLSSKSIILPMFRQIMAKVQAIKISNCNFDSQILTDFMGENLKVLNVSNCNLKDINFLRSCRFLEYLNLSNNKLQEVKALMLCPRIKEMVLANNFFKDVRYLSKCTELRLLDMSRNQISDLDSLNILKFNFQLQYLTLSKNPIANFPNYEEHIKTTIPQLKKLDSSNILQYSEFLLYFKQHDLISSISAIDGSTPRKVKEDGKSTLRSIIKLNDSFNNITPRSIKNVRTSFADDALDLNKSRNDVNNNRNQSRITIDLDSEILRPGSKLDFFDDYDDEERNMFLASKKVL